jgi:hypothetical protein
MITGHVVLIEPPEGAGCWERLVNVCVGSAAAQGLHVVVHRVLVPERIGAAAANSKKLRVWQKIVEEATGPVILMDGDLLVRGKLQEGFEAFPEDCPVAVCERYGVNVPPINGGVVFVRPGKAAKKFFKQWAEVDKLFLRRPKVRKPWRQVYAGQNQAALGFMLEAEGWTVARVPCAVWNECEPWDFYESARVIHFKGRLRRALLGTGEAGNKQERCCVKVFERWERLLQTNT